MENSENNINKGIIERLERIEQLLVIGAKEVLNTKEVALLLGVSVSRINHLAAERKIPYYKQGAKNCFKKTEIERWQTQDKRETVDEMTTKAETQRAVNRVLNG